MICYSLIQEAIVKNLIKKVGISHITVVAMALTGCTTVIQTPSPLSSPMSIPKPSMGAILYSGTQGVVGSVVKLRLEEDVNVNINDNTENKRSGALNSTTGLDLPFIPEWLSHIDAKAQGSASHSSSNSQKSQRRYTSEISGVVVEEQGSLGKVQVVYTSRINGNVRKVLWSGWFNQNALRSGRVLSSTEAADVHWEEY